jgi:hypothetical protein
MIRFLLRFIGLLVLAVAFVALVRDGTKTIAGNAVYVAKLRDDWYIVNANSLDGLQHAAERLAEWLWNPVLETVLDKPTWLVLGILGGFLVVLGRKKKPLIGYARD